MVAAYPFNLLFCWRFAARSSVLTRYRLLFLSFLFLFLGSLGLVNYSLDTSAYRLLLFLLGQPFELLLFLLLSFELSILFCFLFLKLFEILFDLGVSLFSFFLSWKLSQSELLIFVLLKLDCRILFVFWIWIRRLSFQYLRKNFSFCSLKDVFNYTGYFKVNIGIFATGSHGN